jgi:hypothetical protein
MDVEPAQTRWFCPRCGTTLFWRTGSVPGHVGIAGGCFDPLPQQIDASYQDADRLDWIGLPEGVEAKG